MINEWEGAEKRPLPPYIPGQEIVVSISFSCQLPGTHRYCTDDSCECWHHSDPDWEDKMHKPGGPKGNMAVSKGQTGRKKPGVSRWRKKTNEKS